MNVDGLNVMNSRRLFAHIRELQSHKLPAAQWTRATIKTAAGPREVLIHPVTGFTYAANWEPLSVTMLAILMRFFAPQLVKHIQAQTELDFQGNLECARAIGQSYPAN